MQTPIKLLLLSEWEGIDIRINEQEDLLFAEWEKRPDLVADGNVDVGSVRDILGVKR